MKEIKFRAWHKLHEEMQPVEAMYFLEQKIKARTFVSLDSSEYVLMQYTGLKDKNGKEIYFGDFIKYSFHDGDKENDEKDVIARIIESMSNGVGILSNGFISDFWEDDELWDVEVIGNAYENPELEKLVK